MKKSGVLFLSFICALLMSACGKEESLLAESVSDNSLLAESVPSEDGIRSEEEIISMFENMNQDGSLEYIDCVPVSDKAGDRIGAVLFWNPDKETTNVAFFAADGTAQQCAIAAKTASNPDFEYLGDGKVTFQMETESGVLYHQMITISMDGSSVRFISEDDLQK